MWNNSLRELWNILLRYRSVRCEIKFASSRAKRISHAKHISRSEGVFHSPKANFTEKSHPLSRMAFFLAGAEGLEPTTHGFGDRYSTNWAIPLFCANFFTTNILYHIKKQISIPFLKILLIFLPFLVFCWHICYIYDKIWCAIFTFADNKYENISDERSLLLFVLRSRYEILFWH